MTQLLVRIERIERRAIFKGSTFEAKEIIKSLGVARWNSSERSWEVRDFTLSREQLLEKLPNAIIEEDESAASIAALIDETVRRSPRLPAATAHPDIELPAAPAAGPSLPPSLSVAELNTRASQALRAAFPGVVFVHGVLSSVRQGPGGRIFMELAEPDKPDQTIRCIIWNDSPRVTAPLTAAGFSLEPDLQVMFGAQVQLSRKNAALSLSVVRIVAEYTVAKLAAQRERTNERLKAEGVFDRNRSLSLPFLPRRLGLLTSAGGTVINDFRASLDEARFGFELVWCDVRVQGSGAKPAILQGLERLSKVPGLDAVLLFRGGGSASDLSVFNDYDIARAVCLYPLPVLSAIGHQEDQCSVQDVSFAHRGVPKDLGRYFADIVRDRRAVLLHSIRILREGSAQQLRVLQQRLVDRAKGMAGLLSHMHQARAQAVERFACQLPLQARLRVSHALKETSAVSAPSTALASQLISHHLHRVETEGGSALRAARYCFAASLKETVQASARLRQAAGIRVDESLRRLAMFESTLQAGFGCIDRESRAVDALERLFTSLSPEQQLKRGFCIIRAPEMNRLVTSGSDLAKGDEIEIEFFDTRRGARITD